MPSVLSRCLPEARKFVVAFSFVADGDRWLILDWKYSLASLHSRCQFSLVPRTYHNAQHVENRVQVTGKPSSAAAAFIENYHKIFGTPVRFIVAGDVIVFANGLEDLGVVRYFANRFRKSFLSNS
jgi:hypothetical protein